MHLVQHFSKVLIPLYKNCCSWSSSQPFAMQITFSSSETLCPFMDSFSLGKKRSLGARTTHLITRQLKHWLPSKMPAFSHGTQTRSSDGNSLCLSVCQTRDIVTKRKEDLSRILHYTKAHLAEFSEKKNGSWGQPSLPEILGQLAPGWSEIADFEPIFARSASAITHSEKKFN